MLHAIIDQLKTGSITNVFTRGNYQTYPSGPDTENEVLTPYILVYDDYTVSSYFTTENTVFGFMIEVHFPAGYIDELRDYVNYELPQLLDRKVLTDSDGNYFQIFKTMYMTIVSEPNDDSSITGGNDDKTISRSRRFIVPARGR